MDPENTAMTFDALIKPALEACARELEIVVSRGLQNTSPIGGSIYKNFRRRVMVVLNMEITLSFDQSQRNGNPFFGITVKEGGKMHIVSFDKGFHDEGRHTFMIRQENGKNLEGDIFGFFGQRGNINNVSKDKAALMMDWFRRKIKNIAEALEK